MKLTGVVLMIVGLIGGAICLVQIIQPFAPDRDGPPVVNDSSPNLAIPLAISGAAVAIGLLLVMFGGRGYIVSDNPKVRN